MNPTLQNKGMASTSPTQNITTQGTVTPAGVVNFDPNTGQRLAQGQSVVVAPGGNTYGSTPYSAQSLTTLSSDKSKDIASSTQKLDQISQKGITTDTSTGVSTYADGTAYNPAPTHPTDPTFMGQLQRDTTEIKTVVNNPDGSRTVYFKDGNSQLISADPNAPTSASNEETEINNILGKMRSESDSVTSAQIADIQQRYKSLKEQQLKINASREATTKGALIRSGAAEHDVYAQKTVEQEVQRSAQSIKDLEDEEQNLINQAKAAQASNNFKILEKSLALAESKRQEKMEATAELNKKLLEEQKKAREAQMQSSRDDAVSSLFLQGITDVPTMLDYLNYDEKGKKIGDFTAKEISETLKNIVPEGLDDLVKTLRTNGAPPEVIRKVMTSSNISDAYDAAGNFASGGTGIVGEYNFAVANGYTGSFSEYQNEDANRKKSIARAGASKTTVSGGDSLTSPLYNGLSSATATAVRSQVSAYKTEPTIQNFNILQEGYNFAKSLPDSTKNPADDQALVYSLAKALDPGSVVREGEYATAQKYSQSWLKAYGKGIEQALNGTGFLSETARKNIKNTIESKYKASKASYDNIRKEYVEGINDLTGRTDGDKFVKDYALPISQSIVDDENTAKTQVNGILVRNPKAIDIVKVLTTQGKPNAKILEYLNLQGYK